MRSQLIKSWVFLLSSMTAMSALAQADKVDLSQLEKHGIQVAEVSKTDIEGLYQVTSNQGLFYVSADGTRLIAGNMFNMAAAQPENLTEQALAKSRKTMIKQVEDEAIEYTASNEKYQITVFTDTTCGYCRRLHGYLGDYLDKGISVRYLAFPRGGMASQGATELAQAWCADDPAQAISDLMHEKSVDSTKCNAPIAKHYQLGQAMGVTGTPAIVLPDGRLLPGARQASAVLQELQ